MLILYEMRKTNRRVCSNYRELTVLSLPGKVYSGVLRGRSADNQNVGFRKSKVVFVRTLHVCFAALGKALAAPSVRDLQLSLDRFRGQA